MLHKKVAQQQLLKRENELFFFHMEANLLHGRQGFRSKRGRTSPLNATFPTNVYCSFKTQILKKMRKKRKLTFHADGENAFTLELRGNFASGVRVSLG